MYNIPTKNVKKRIHFHLVWFIFSIIFFLVIGSIICIKYKDLIGLDSSVMSRGVRLKSNRNDDGITTYSSIYYYRVDGIDYTCSPGLTSKTKPHTENKMIYYSSKDTSKCMADNSKLSIKVCLLLLAISILMFIFSITNIKKKKEKLKIIERLNKNGKLIKNLPYHLENNKRPAINYILPSGESVVLYGNSNLTKKKKDKDTLDLVIDEDNPRNYYINFEINRLSGNLPEDYFKQTSQEKKEEEEEEILDENIEDEIECLDKEQDIDNEIEEMI